MPSVVYGDLTVDVTEDELQLLRRRLFERKDSLARSAEAATAIDEGLLRGKVQLEHHHVLAIGEVLGELAGERRLISGLRELYSKLREEADHSLGGERGQDG